MQKQMKSLEQSWWLEHPNHAPTWYSTAGGQFLGDQFSAAQITQHYRIRADLSFLDCSWWNEDLRKCVHGSLDGVTLDAWHRVQDLLCQFGLLSQGVQDRALLLSIRRTHNTGVTKNDDITHINDCVFILYSTWITQSFHLRTSLIISSFTLKQQCDKLVVVCLLNCDFQWSTFGQLRLSYITKLQSQTLVCHLLS